MRKYGFTLAEVLITLAIIGVVAAVAIPSVISNSQQQEFKTGLKKAVSVLNSAITVNMALDGETPYDNANLYGFLMKHMSVLKSGALSYYSAYKNLNGTTTAWDINYAFYTTDGIKFEFDLLGANKTHLKLHESNIAACGATPSGGYTYYTDTNGNPGVRGFCGGCGSYGLKSNPNNTTKPPCAIMVDVNGDRKPNPSNVNAVYGGTEHSSEHVAAAYYKVAAPGSKLIGDIFTILITEDRAIPYGVVAQKAMYEAQKQGY